MYTIEKVIRNIKGQDKEVRAFFGKGRLTADVPEIRLAKDLKVMSAFGFSLACDAGKNTDGSRKSVFFPVTLWEKNADNILKISESVKKQEVELGMMPRGLKGREILIFGRIEKQTYTSNSGESKESEVLIVERFGFSDYPRATTNNTNASNVQESPTSSTATDDFKDEGYTEVFNEEDDEFEEIDEFEDIPF
ncbi:MAG: hypothetical protein K0R54_96 [Clostridiaceae bacterium]|jgi:single-stranded DNA-binding protein|nr:hypothetical protein [Clostridiaceae bacterium]